MNALLQTAQRRLYPSLSDPSYLVLRSRRLIFSRWIRELGGNLRVLDVGGRYQPYRPLLDRHLGSYVAVDIARTELVNVVASGEALPFPPHSFDLVIATQVFEYFSDPAAAATQIHLVLRQGGVLLASLAGLTPRFVDEERWRFTPAGLQTLFRTFSSIEIVPELSSLGSMIRTNNAALYTFSKYAWLRSLYKATACPIFNLSGLLLEKMRPTSNDQFAANFSVRATK